MFPQIGDLVDKLHDNDICHNDLHVRNIMYKKLNNGSIRLYLIDFDRSTFKNQFCRKDINNMSKLQRIVSPNVGMF